MVSCMNSEGAVENYPLFAFLCIKSSPEDHSTRSVEALRILLRNVSLKGLMELESLDFQPCIAALVCENLAAALFESRSAFALESLMSRSGLDYFTREQSLRALIKNTQHAFERVDQWLLKPLRQIECRIGENWKSVSRISRKDKFECLFKDSAAVTRQFERVKQNMHNIVDGSYAAVSISVFADLLNQLEAMPDSCIDVPLLGRALMGVKHLDTVRCYMVEPCFSCFECQLVSIAFQCSNGIKEEKHFLRILMSSLKQLKIDRVPIGGKFEFIVSNCSTVFIEETVSISDSSHRARPISPDFVRWCDLSLSEGPGEVHPEPLYDVQVELRPAVTQRISVGGYQPSTVTSSGCIVGQRVTMNISFCLPKPITFPVRIHVVLDDAFEYGSDRRSQVVTFLPLKKTSRYRIKDVVTDKGRYRLMDVLFNTDGERYEGRITLSFEAKNPSGERLDCGACFVYLKVDDTFCDAISLEDDPALYTDFAVRAPVANPTLACLACGVAQTPAIHNMPITHCEMLVSKARLGEASVDIMLTFQCSVKVLVFNSASDRQQAVVEIVLPNSWPPFPEPAVRRTVKFSCVDADGEGVDIHADHCEVEHSKIVIRLSAGESRQGRPTVFLNENCKCCFIIKGVALPQAPVQMTNALEKMKECSTKLATGVQSESDYEQLKKDSDDAASVLGFFKESLSSGCVVTIKDANGSIVMTCRELPISPLLTEGEFATVIDRKTLEASEYKSIHDETRGVTCLNEFEFGRLVMDFNQAFVAHKCGGDESIIKRHQTAVKKFNSDINDALFDKRTENLLKSFLRQPKNAHVDAAQDHRAFKIYAMAAQLWTSAIKLELDHQNFRFYEIVNRYTLSADNGELLRMGMLLIKAINRNIVRQDANDVRAAAAANVAAAAFGGGGNGAAPAVGGNSPIALPKKVSAKPVEHSLYYRGGSLPFELAGFFFPGKVFRFPAFLATSCQEKVAIDFAVKVKNDNERVKWKISAPADCLHFKALQENSLLPHEEEFLFPPYSAFRVISNRREEIEHPSSEVPLPCRIICLEALADNKAQEATGVPTAPRY